MKELLKHWLELKNEERILKEKREEILNLSTTRNFKKNNKDET